MVIAVKFVHSEPGMKHGHCVSMFQQKPGLAGRRAIAEKKEEVPCGQPGGFSRASALLGAWEKVPDALLLGHSMSSRASLQAGGAAFLLGAGLCPSRRQAAILNPGCPCQPPGGSATPQPQS